MKYSLLIVEDEKIIREGFTRVVSEQENFTVTAVRSGEEALKVIESCQIDAMLLDIKLPGMSGLDVLDHIQDQGADEILTIIVSGYNDFDYARKAVNLHVFDYILKPITPDRVRELIGRLAEELGRQHSKDTDRKLLEKRISLARPLLKQSFFGDILDEALTDEELLERARFLDMHMEAGYYRVILIKRDRVSAIEKSEFFSQAAVQEIHEIILQYPWPEAIECFYLTSYSFAVIQMVHNSSNQHMQEYQLLRKMYYRIRRDTGIGVVLGIGNWVDSVASIKESFRQASVALGYTYPEGMMYNPCRYYKDIVFPNAPAGVEYVLDEKIAKALYTLNRDELITIIREQISAFNASGFMQGYTFIVHYVHTLLDFTNEYAGIATTDFDHLITELFTLLGRRAVFAYEDSLIALTDQVIRRIELERSKLNNNLVQIIKKYIFDNFHEAIRIGDIAETIGYSPNYIGVVFKRETEQTIHEYWHMVRVDKAKQLLKKKGLLIAEIAERVGYNDQYYFSNVFKRYTGHSPKQFRNR